MSTGKTIGILGGLGPYAGLDLVRKIFDQTNARSDQDHLSIALVSMPAEIEDRTAFLMDKSDVNPAHAISELIGRLINMGAEIIGIPCNTAHHPRILNVVTADLKETWPQVTMLNMLEETGDYIQKEFAAGIKVSLLCTTGIAQTGVYQETLISRGIKTVAISPDVQDALHRVIYDRTYGIKAFSNPVTETARTRLLDIISGLGAAGAEAIVLGCTELPLALEDKTVGAVRIVDPTLILARALIREANPEKLRLQDPAQ